jgi:hypothetical protein
VGSSLTIRATDVRRKLMSTGTLHAEPALVNAVLASDLTVGDLWLRYCVRGGDRTRQELQAYLGLESRWGVHDHDMLADALIH